MSIGVHLDEQQLEQLADLIADRISDRSDGQLVTASELADRLGRSREFVYEHAQQLGAIRLGDGERPRLLFRWPQALDKLANTTDMAITPRRTPTRRRQAKPSNRNLLPIRGQQS